MNKRKIWMGFVSLIIMSFLLFGCTHVEKTTKTIYDEPWYEWGKVKNQTITVWGNYNDINRAYMKKAFKRYEDMTGNKIVCVALKGENLEKKVSDAFKMDLEEKPDVLLSFGGTNLINLDPDKNFYDFTHAAWVEDLTDTAMNQTIYNGKVMGLPHWEASISGTIYNKKIFERLNIPVPTTQEEFLKVCEKLLKNGITPVYMPYAETSMLLYQFPMDSIVEDPKTLEGLNSGALAYKNIPEMKKILEWYKTMGDKGYFGESYKDNNWDGMNDAMLSEKYAMMLCWDTWLYTDYTGKPSEFGLMPAFMSVPLSGSFEGPNLSLLLANKNSPNLGASIDLITFMADPYNYNVAFEGVYTAPVFNNQVGSISTPQYAESERLIEELFYDSTAWLRIRGFSQMDAIYIQNYMQGKSSLEESLNNMDAARTKRGLKPL